MPPKPPLEAHQLQILGDDLTLLHLLFHRNKNQHRLLKWWQWIATLRRNLNKLLHEHDDITTAKSTPQRDIAIKRFKERILFLRKIVIPNAYRAFGTVVAMRGFAALGLILLGILARVWKFIRPSKEEINAETEIPEGDRMKNLDIGIDQELGVIVPRELYDKGEIRKELSVIASQGESKIQRTQSSDTRDNQSKTTPEFSKTPQFTKNEIKSGSIPGGSPKEILKRRLDSFEISTQTKPTKRKKKNKLRGKDDIDDLFSSLL